MELGRVRRQYGKLRPFSPCGSTRLMHRRKPRREASVQLQASAPSCRPVEATERHAAPVRKSDEHRLGDGELADGDGRPSARPTSAVGPLSFSNPLDGSTSPDRILNSVDLPAPFSPTSACTSPTFTSNETPSSARTPGNVFTIPVMRSNGAGCAAAVTLVYLPASALVYVPTATAIFAGGVLPPKKSWIASIVFDPIWSGCWIASPYMAPWAIAVRASGAAS